MAELPAAYLAYLAKRDAQRADAITGFLASLTDRERALIRDAAVMGYVRGRMHPSSEPHPKDSAVLAEVVDSCLAITDMYPAISTDAKTPYPPSSAWTFEGNYEADKWHGIGSTYLNDEYDQALTDFKQRAENDKQHRKFRMIRADTVCTVVAEYDPDRQP
jgi:hypothetical protein